MSTKTIGNTGARIDSALDSAEDLNRLSLSAAERLAQFHFEKVRGAGELSLDYLRALLTVKDAKSLQEFVSSRVKVLEQLGKQLQEDVKTLADIGSSYTSEAQKLLSKQFKSEEAGKKAA